MKTIGDVVDEVGVVNMTLTAEFTLPCGCVLRHTNINAGDRTVDPVIAKRFLEVGSALIEHWYRTRRERHRCDLVTVDNPNGIRDPAGAGA